MNTDIVLANRLRRDGHEVTIYASRASGAAVAEQNNTPFESYQRDHLTTLFSSWSHTQHSPELILVHAELHREQLHALAAGYPTVALETQASPDQVACVPPLSCRWRPRWMPRMTAAIAWRQLYRQRNANPDFRQQVASLKQLARQLGLDFDAIVTFRHWHPIRFNAVPYLCLSLEEFDFPTDAPRPTRFVGPLIDIARAEPCDAELNAWLTDQARGPLIYCSLGSLQSQRQALENVVAATRLRPEWRWLIGTLALPDSACEALTTDADHVRMVRNVPQCHVLKCAGAMITGAGIASINECIVTETPMLAHSLGVLDQNGNAARVAYHGLGNQVDLLTLSAASICALLDDLLTGTHYAHALRAMRAAYDRHIESDRAVKTLMSVI